MNTEKIGKGIYMNLIEGNKFKTNMAAVLIKTQLNKDTATKNALLIRVLSNSVSDCLGKTEFNKKLEELHGATFAGEIIKKGDEQILYFCIETIKGNEEITEGSIKLLSDIIKKPSLENNSFKKNIFKREYDILKNILYSRSDDKREYSATRCIEEMFPDEPFGIYGDGYAEDLEKITPENLYKHYTNIISSAPIDIVFSGDIDENIPKLIKKHFDINSRQNSFNKIDKISNDIKDTKLKEKSEKMDITQGKLSLGFKTGLSPVGKPFFSSLVMNEILGVGANSRLYNAVREKENMCYYISSIFYRFKMMFMVQAGIEPENYKKAVDTIIQVVEDFKNSNVTTEELETAKNNIISNYDSLEDYQSSVIDFFMSEKMVGGVNSIEEFIEGIKAVKAQDIKKSADALTADTIFFLSNKEENVYVNNY